MRLRDRASRILQLDVSGRPGPRNDDEHVHEHRARIERATAELAAIEAEREKAERRLARLQEELATQASGVDELAPPRRPRSASEKVALFRSLFHGRTDVLPL